jgi:hypothetical protein
MYKYQRAKAWDLHAPELGLHAPSTRTKKCPKRKMYTASSTVAAMRNQILKIKMQQSWNF